MRIQSLSIVVPNSGCVNKCAFCVSRMHTDTYPNLMNENLPLYDLYERDYIKRLEFARDNGCNTIMLTGQSEPQQNKLFLQRFGTMNMNLAKPFRWIEMQTTGTMIDAPYLRFLRNHVGVNTISVSISSFEDDANNQIICTPKAHQIELKKLCDEIKKYDFNLRLSINLNDEFNKFKSDPESFFKYCKNLGADQATMRILYTGDNNTEQAAWIRSHNIDEVVSKELQDYVTINGRVLETLEYGRIKYSVMGLSIVIDDDCMATETSDTYKYLILRQNAKLYSKWDDPASLIF